MMEDRRDEGGSRRRTLLKRKRKRRSRRLKRMRRMKRWRIALKMATLGRKKFIDVPMTINIKIIVKASHDICF